MGEMEKAAYKQLLNREEHYEKKLREAETKAYKTIENARKEAQKQTQTILKEAQEHIIKEDEQAKATQKAHEKTLATNQERFLRTLKRKEKRLPELTENIAEQLLKEWLTR